MFLLVAQELSISRAARQAYVTQQCASDHIRKLEEEYGVALFERRPRLRLTRAGELLLNTVRQTEKLEHMLCQQLHELKGETSGEISVGMNPTRARILMPELLAAFQSFFPNVKVVCMLGDTVELGQLLLANKLDLFVGVDVASNPAFCRRELGREQIFFLATRQLCQKFLPGEAVERLQQTGVSLGQLAQVPMIRNLTASTLNLQIDRSLNQHNAAVQAAYFISDYDTQIAMCGSGLGASFCPLLVLTRVFEYNRCRPPEEQVHIFPISGVPDVLRIDLVTPSGVEQPKFTVKLMQLLTEQICGQYAQLAPYHGLEK